jgi:hypothetical protein
MSSMLPHRAKYTAWRPFGTVGRELVEPCFLIHYQNTAAHYTVVFAMLLTQLYCVLAAMSQSQQQQFDPSKPPAGDEMSTKLLFPGSLPKRFPPELVVGSVVGAGGGGGADIVSVLGTGSPVVRSK